MAPHGIMVAMVLSPDSLPPVLAQAPITARVRALLPWLVAVAFFMEALDTTILNTAVPALSADLGVAALSVKSVLSSYTLSVAVFIPLSSWLADRFGTRRTFFSAIALFTLGSVLCGLARSIQAMVLWRILQGFGGAMMVPVGRQTLVRTVDKADLVRAMSLVAIPTLVGPMLGPVLGGFLVTLYSWRMTFFVNLPVGLLGLVLVYRYLPDYRVEGPEPLDVVGLILFGAGVALLSYVLEVFGETSLSPLEMAGLLGLSAVLLLGYGLHARGLARPLLDLGLFRVRSFRASTFGNLITRLGAGGLPFLLPLLYQLGMGYNPLQSGLLLMPQSLSALAFKMTMPPLLRRFGYKRVLLANTLAIGGAIALYAAVGPGTPVWAMVVLACAFGYAASLQYTSMNTLVYADVPEAATGMASTILSSVQQLAISFGVAGSGILTVFLIPHGAGQGPAGLLHGLHLCFLIMGIFTALSALVFHQLKDGDGDTLSLHHEASAAHGL